MSATVQAQVKQTNKENPGMGTSMSSMEDCMNKIVADSSARNQMIAKMMDHMKGDTAAMMQMHKQMMKDPQMHEMMMKMMQRHMGSEGMGSMMKGDMKNEPSDTAKMPHHQMP
jgi:lipopolysaccharide biosynthesis regulator YciM